MLFSKLERFPLDFNYDFPPPAAAPTGEIGWDEQKQCVSWFDKCPECGALLVDDEVCQCKKRELYL